MISSLTTEGVVFSQPVLKIAPNGNEFLAMTVGLFNIKETGPQTFSKLECTLWSNPSLMRQIMEMDLQPRDRVLINGKFTIKIMYGKPKLRLYIYDFTLLSRATSSTKNVDYTPENIDYSILNDVEVFDTNPVKLRDYDNVSEKLEEMDNEVF